MRKEHLLPNEMYMKQSGEAHNRISLRLSPQEIKGLKEYIRLSGKSMTLEMAVKDILKAVLRD